MTRFLLMVLIAGFLGVVECTALPTPAQVRQATDDYIRQKNEPKGIEKFTGVLADRMRITMRPGPDRLALYSTVADCVRLMKLTQKARLSDETLNWILSSSERLNLLVKTVTPRDRLKACFGIIESLATHDPADHDEYYDLILAMSVVWDMPNRPCVHGQMGSMPPKYKPEVTKRYDYFKDLYKSGDAKVDYSKLSVYDLIFVVDTPVPLDELQWVRENVDGSVGSWGRKFQEIEYDYARLDAGQYSWPQGEYRLAAIKARGGICVDQAYYCVMTARAYGIPSIFFDALGNSGGHAWFAYLRAAGKWDLDVGRYESHHYTTGSAINSQTDQTMTDHDVEFACERSGKSVKRIKAERYMSIADAVRGKAPLVAKNCAHEARRLFPRDLRAWNLELELLIADKDYDGMMALFKEQKDVFRKYPDILANSATRMRKVLMDQGHNEEAEELTKSLGGAVDDDRDDIKRDVELARIKGIYASGDSKKALREFEQLLDDQMKDGAKVLPLMSQFPALAYEHGQQQEAAMFLEDYVTRMLKQERLQPTLKRLFLDVAMAAYKCSKDLEGQRRIQKLIDRYSID